MVKRVRWFIWTAFAAAVLYVGASVYFMDHFFWGTSINGEKADFLTTAQAEEMIRRQTEEYRIVLKGRGGYEESVDVREMGIVFSPAEDAQRAKRRQNGFLWPRMLWRKDSYTVIPGRKKDGGEFVRQAEKLSCIREGQPPENAWVELTEEGYTVHPEKQGTKIREEVFYEEFMEAVSMLAPVLDLEESGCYEPVTITAESEEVTALTQKLEHWLGAEVTYTFGPESEVVDRTVIRDFIVLEGYEASLDEEAVSAWIQGLADRRDTYKKPRNFKSTLRGTITVKGSAFGWQIDQEAESASLLRHIEEGRQIAGEPAYSHTGNPWSSNYDIGDTYIEIDMSAQKMWFYKDGEQLVETDVVTGNTSRGWRTPEMVAAVKYKDKNAVLRGANYATPVTYWMPFHGNYGIHDADWRRKFGGNIYKTDGSHGCVNTPPAAMKIIFENAEKGTPVILYD